MFQNPAHVPEIVGQVRDPARGLQPTIQAVLENRIDPAPSLFDPTDPVLSLLDLATGPAMALAVDLLDQTNPATEPGIDRHVPIDRVTVSVIDRIDLVKETIDHPVPATEPRIARHVLIDRATVSVIDRIDLVKETIDHPVPATEAGIDRHVLIDRAMAPEIVQIDPVKETIDQTAPATASGIDHHVLIDQAAEPVIALTAPVKETDHPVPIDRAMVPAIALAALEMEIDQNVRNIDLAIGLEASVVIDLTALIGRTTDGETTITTGLVVTGFKTTLPTFKTTGTSTPIPIISIDVPGIGGATTGVLTTTGTLTTIDLGTTPGITAVGTTTTEIQQPLSELVSRQVRLHPGCGDLQSISRVITPIPTLILQSPPL